MNELIQRILSEGTKTTILEEVVLGGILYRPLTNSYISQEGQVLESIEYAEPADSRAWGAIKSISYQLINDYDPELQQVINDRKFGNDLINQYLKENKILKLTTSQSLQQLQKFTSAKALLETGALTASLEIIQNIQPDEIFTEDRKQKYISSITNYLNE